MEKKFLNDTLANNRSRLNVNKCMTNSNSLNTSDIKPTNSTVNQDDNYDGMINKMFDYLKGKVSSEILTNLTEIVAVEAQKIGKDKKEAILNSSKIENKNFKSYSRNEKKSRQNNGIHVHPSYIEETNEEADISLEFTNGGEINKIRNNYTSDGERHKINSLTQSSFTNFKPFVSSKINSRLNNYSFSNQSIEKNSNLKVKTNLIKSDFLKINYNKNSKNLQNNYLTDSKNLRESLKARETSTKSKNSKNNSYVLIKTNSVSKEKRKALNNKSMPKSEYISINKKENVYNPNLKNMKLKFLVSNSVSKSNSNEKSSKNVNCLTNKKYIHNVKNANKNILNITTTKTTKLENNKIPTNNFNYNNKLSKKVSVSPVNKQIKPNLKIEVFDNTNNVYPFKSHVNNFDYNLNKFIKHGTPLQTNKLIRKNLNTSSTQHQNINKNPSEAYSINNFNISNNNFSFKPKYSEISLEKGKSYISNNHSLIKKSNLLNLNLILNPINTSGRETYASNGSSIPESSSKRQVTNRTKKVVASYNFNNACQEDKFNYQDNLVISEKEEKPFNCNFNYKNSDKGLICIEGEKINNSTNSANSTKNRIESNQIIKEIKSNIESNLKGLFNFSYENFLRDQSQSTHSEKIFDDLDFDFN